MKFDWSNAELTSKIVQYLSINTVNIFAFYWWYYRVQLIENLKSPKIMYFPDNAVDFGIFPTAHWHSQRAQFWFHHLLAWNALRPLSRPSSFGTWHWTRVFHLRRMLSSLANLAELGSKICERISIRRRRPLELGFSSLNLLASSNLLSNSNSESEKKIKSHKLCHPLRKFPAENLWFVVDFLGINSN